ncbi:transglycosylase SLT domain-containing protein [Paraferrimonas sedimenticola]|uniref:Lytic transglycosylase n=1 Tax=Paraferrimonas sedimenticola TaxID=375674 RepID=A0AA37VWP9_9GAMM|nr:transglycosylase SLT domain-containing protein [Paraferrimonas sedimenticola]GLP96476.1 lytic transglycosylase [Paraferrimonas sedimenticola]
MSTVLMRALLLLGSTALTLNSYASTAHNEQFNQALDAIRKGDNSQYQSLRKQLDDYPLAPYLDYEKRIAQVGRMSLKDFQQFSESLSETPLYNRARHRYLMAKGKRKQWSEFLAVSPQEPRDTRLQCYYYRAQLQKGDKALGYKGANRLWLTGRSQVDQCDVLFSEWQKAGKRTDQQVWNRMLLSFEAGQTSLTRYLGSLLSDDNKKLGQALLGVYSDPRRLKQVSNYTNDHTWVEEIVSVGLKRLSRRDLKASLDLYERYQAKGRFSKANSYNLKNALLRQALIKKPEKLQAQIDRLLEGSEQDSLVEIRIRWAIAEQNWQHIAFWIEQLSDKAKAKDRWQFWMARYLSQDQQEQAAQNILQDLAQHRGFYGFMAAEQLNLPMALKSQSPTPQADSQTLIAQLDGIQRVQALIDVERHQDARSEWLYLLARQPQHKMEQLALYAADQGWSYFAIEAAIRAKAWDAVELRFPTVYNDIFEQFAKMRNVDAADLLAIARRESAYNPQATSHVGARGLMQLMPQTAKITANKIGFRYKGTGQLYQPHPNIRLASAYYKELLGQFDNNRILAASSYNAGPNRTKAWLKKSDGNLDPVSFIETIPFRETREYVQAVLSYRAIYQMLNQQSPSLLSEDERSWRY